MKRRNDIEKSFCAKLGFYSLRSKSLNFFNVPFQAVGDVDALNRIATTLNSDKVALANAHDLEVFRIGIFDPSTGVFDGSARCLVCDDVLSIPSLVSKAVETPQDIISKVQKEVEECENE